MYEIKGMNGQVVGKYNPETDTIEEINRTNNEIEPIKEDDDIHIQEGGKVEDCSMKNAKILKRDKKMPDDRGVISTFPVSIVGISLLILVYAMRN